jgi:tape measure domain-containing protein
MAGVLEYALRLNTGGFNGPLEQSLRTLLRLDTQARSNNSSLVALTSGLGSAGAAMLLLKATTAASLAVLESYAPYDGLVRGLKTLEGTAPATMRRLEQLREISRAPGLGFEEVVRGDIRLRSAGLSADLSTRSLSAFGNALALVGSGGAELQGVLLALTQIHSKGVVSAEEINQIAERLPQIRTAMLGAFGTASTEAIQKMGVSSEEFISRIVAELEKLPRVTGGARTVLENYKDDWSALKTTAAEFGAEMSGSWVSGVSGAFRQARRDLESLKNLMGVKTPGLGGKDGETDAQRSAKKLADEQGKAAAKVAADEAEAAARSAAFWAEAEAERTEHLKQESERRAEETKRNLEEIRKLGEAHAQAVLGEEAFLQQKIAQLRKGALTSAQIDALPAGSAQQLTAAKQAAELAQLEERLKDLQTSKAEEAEREALAKKEQLTMQQQAKALFDQENGILSARIAGNDKLATAIERQMKVEQLKLQLIREQGLGEAEALATAEKRVALEERAEGVRRRGLLNAADSAAAQQERRDRANVRLGRDANSLGNSDRLALADLERRRARGLEDSARELGRGRNGMDPGKDRREERRNQERKEADPVLPEVKEIKQLFSNLATA